MLTVGHSDRPVEEFLGLLERHGVRTLVDIRTVPRSRRVPWATIDALPGLLGARGIRYVHLAALGGLRKPRPGSVNAAWRNRSFQGYADHMQTEEFARGLDALLALAAESPTAIMCAEAVPWKCHRSLVTDALLARGVEVKHVLDGELRDAAMTPFARVEGGRVTYPAAPGRQATLDVQ